MHGGSLKIVLGAIAGCTVLLFILYYTNPTLFYMLLAFAVFVMFIFAMPRGRRERNPHEQMAYEEEMARIEARKDYRDEHKPYRRPRPLSMDEMIWGPRRKGKSRGGFSL